MKTGYKIAIGLGVITLSAFGIGYYLKTKKKKKSTESKDSYHAYNQTAEIKKKKPSVPISDEFPLRLGSKGPRVERLQIWLMRNFGRTAPVNGIFDEETQNKVIKHLKTKIVGSELYNRYAMGKPVYTSKV